MERTFCERISEHAFKDKNSVVYNHIDNCDGVKYLIDLLNIYQVQTACDKFDKNIYGVVMLKKTSVSLIGQGDETFFYLKKHFI